MKLLDRTRRTGRSKNKKYLKNSIVLYTNKDYNNQNDKNPNTTSIISKVFFLKKYIKHRYIQHSKLLLLIFYLILININLSTKVIILEISYLLSNIIEIIIIKNSLYSNETMQTVAGYIKLIKKDGNYYQISM